ncbi:unnamed protein product [Medioppia subpectinata]|uniref:ABC transporter G family member 23 n=1 Tax=Medioppia subpectinata TaxID=1979941 RepID=A0A7R9KTT4_9ACAR|nr:unnamed protein product [Medioppia subpectinata]CAG2109369.1 unnamed protein product [Medioppia subpectinata]
MFNLYASWDSYEADEDVACDVDRSISLASFRRNVDTNGSIRRIPEPIISDAIQEIEEIKDCDLEANCEKQEPVVAAVEIVNAFYSYGKKKKVVNALQGISLTVPEGSIYGLLGPSGCGKTSLLRCIVGRLHPKEGAIRVFGKKPGEAGSRVPGASIGYMPQELALFPDFTLEETLNYFGRLYHMKERIIAERTDFLLKFLDLPEKGRLVGNLSGGQKRRVSLAAALVHNPPLLILDEPTVGVDPLLRQCIWDYLVTLSKEESLTVIITTHYIEEARAANLVSLMRFGRILTEQTPEYLLKRYGFPTLEEVFLKVCSLDAQGIDVNSLHKEVIRSNSLDNTPDICFDVNKSESKDVDINASISSASSSSGVGESVHNLKNIKGSNDSMEMVANACQKSKKTNKSVNKFKHSTNPLMDSAARTSALFWKNITRLRRNMAVLLFQFLLPSIEVILFCTCIGQHPFDIPVAVYNEEPMGQFSQQFLNHIDNNTIIQMPFPSYDTAIEAVKNGDAWAALVIGRNFTNALQLRVMMAGEVDNATLDMSSIHLYPDMTNQMISLKLYETITLSFISFGKDMLSTLGQSSSLVELPVVMEKPIYGDRAPTFTEFMAPGVVLSIAFLAAVALTALAFVMERKEGLLERSLVAGVSSTEFMLSHVLTQLLVLSVQVALLLIFTFLVFEIPFRGQFIWVIVLTLLQGSCGMAFGLMISAICEEENSATMLALGSFYPNLLLSGTVWPTQSMPTFIRYFSYILPQTIPIEAMRYILSRGWDLSYGIVALGFGVTIIWIIFFLTAAVIIFKYRNVLQIMFPAAPIRHNHIDFVGGFWAHNEYNINTSLDKLSDLKVWYVVLTIFVSVIIVINLFIGFATTGTAGTKKGKPCRTCGCTRASTTSCLIKTVFVVNYILFYFLVLLAIIVLLTLFVCYVLSDLCNEGIDLIVEPLNVNNPFPNDIRAGQSSQYLDLRQFSPLLSLRANETQFLYFKDNRLKKLCDDYVSALYFHIILCSIGMVSLCAGFLNFLINLSVNWVRISAKQKYAEILYLNGAEMTAFNEGSSRY